MREWLLVVHVATAMVYVGGHLIENVMLFRSRQGGGPMGVFRAIHAGEPAINVAAPIMILTGVGLVVEGDAFDFSSVFVLIGIGAIVASAVIGLPLLREMKNLEALGAERGEADPEVARRFRRFSAWWSVLGVVYLVAAWAMVVKP